MKYLKINKKYFKSTIFLFLLSYFLFYLSLEKCFEGEDICCMKFKWMKKKIIEESISIILVVILFQLMIRSIISKLHLIHFSIAFILFYVYSHGITFDDHGLYNIKFYFTIIIPIFIFIYIIKYLLFIKNKKIIFIYIFLIAIIMFQISYNIIYYCNDWGKGLNNTFIENNKTKYGCLIKIPKTCPYKIGKYFLDRFRTDSPNCLKNGLKSKQILFKFSKSPYINKETNHFGFPIINKEVKLFHLENFLNLKKYVARNLIDMNNFTLLKSMKERIPEVSVDFSQKKIGEIKINLNFNKTLSKERKKLERYTNPYSRNLLVIYIDSVSRAYSIRQLKKTLKFFEKFIFYKGNHNKNYPSENFHSFQFFKYHSHDFFTPGNYPILFYGNHRKKDNKYITLYLKQNGYITAYSADSCLYEFCRALHNFSFHDIYDHHYVICNPNFNRINSELKCFHGKLYLEHMIEYMEQFWRKYQMNRKFSLFLTNFAHEGSLEILKYMDNIIYGYLNKLYQNNLLKDTSVFLLSDHGTSLPSIYYLNEFYQIEMNLPMFYLLVNDRKNMTYELQYKYLYNNQQSFITAFDIYDTIINLIYGDKFDTNITKNIKSKYGESLFKKIDSKRRSPKLYKNMTRYSCI